MKKIISIALILMLVLSLGVAGYALPVRADDESTTAQLNLIYSNFSSFKQDDATGTWRYSITDLDHNGRFEILAAGVLADGHTTTLKAWEVNADMKSFIACNVNLKDGKSFPDIIAENADTYYVPGTDSWYYMFNDDTVVSATEVVSEKCSVNFKNGNFFSETYGSAVSTAENGITVVSYMDNHGALVTPDVYNAFGANAFVGAERSSTNFGWFSAADVQDASRLSTSYAMFKGIVQPEKAPITQAPAAVAAPAATPELLIISTPSSFLSITKHPTNESHYVGETALFVANASSWTSLNWTFVSPSGGEYTAQSFAGTFPYATVTGTGGTTLSIANLNEGMSGWGVYCTFYNNGQSARTNTAYMYVMMKSASTGTGKTTTTNTNNSGVYFVPGYYSTYYGNDVYTQYSTGTQSYQSSDGSVTYFYTDGTATYVAPDGTVTDYDNNGFSTTYLTDGSSVIDYGDSVEYRYNDGSSLILNDDGSSLYGFSDGSMIAYENDGSFITYDTDGNINGGGIDYDYIPEVYSDIYGWGNLDWDWDW